MSTTKGDNNRVRQINNGLKRYYESLNEHYNDDFFNYCIIQEYMDDNFEEEMDNEVNDCMLIEFHVTKDQWTFPFNDKYQDKDENEKRNHIYYLIKQCDQNKNIAFINGAISENSHENAVSLQKSHHEISDNKNNQIDQPEIPSQKLHDETNHTRIKQKALQICDGMRKHYKSHNMKYSNTFYSFCEEQGYLDDDALNDELKQDLEDCSLIEFYKGDDNIGEFPFNEDYKKKDKSAQDKFIYELIQKYALLQPNDDITEFLELRPIINKIDTYLKYYYEEKGKAYDHKFARYCQENGICDEDITDELSHNDNQLTAFDKDFPCSIKVSNKEDEIQRILTQILENPQYFNLPEFMKQENLIQLFNINTEKLKQIAIRYRKQCPVLWYACGLRTDMTFLLLLAVGDYNRYPYIIYLINDYSRRRAEWEGSEAQRRQREKTKSENNQRGIKKYMTPTWLTQNRHVIAVLKQKCIINDVGDIKLDDEELEYKHDAYANDAEYQLLNVTDKELNEATFQKPTTKSLMESAPNLFGKRICPPLQLSTIIKINDSLEVTARCFYAVTQLVKDLLSNPGMWLRQKMAVCPFQLDFCMVLDEPLEDTIDDNPLSTDDEDSDDEEKKDEERNGWIDCIGDIEKKLNKNKLKFACRHLYPKQEDDYDYFVARDFGELIKDYQDACQKEGNPYDIEGERFIIMYDRRKKNKNIGKPYIEDNPKPTNLMDDQEKSQKYVREKMYMYRPPANCRTIPSEPVPEWGYVTIYSIHVILYFDRVQIIYI